MTRRTPLCALLALAASLLTPGCPPSGGGGTGGGGGQDALDQALARKKLIVAMDVGYDPFEVVLPDGSFGGFDVDLCREVAADLGVELELKNVAWTGIVSELQTGKVDAIFSGMSITAEREKTVDFSRPYYSVGQVVVKRKGDVRIGSWQDLNKQGMVVATQQGTTGEQAIKDFMPQAEVKRFDKIDLGCVDLAQKRADAVVFDHPFCMKYVAGHPELEGIWQPFTEEKIAAALRQDSPKLREAIDRTIQRLESGGRMAELERKHFPPRPEAPVPGK